MRRTRILLVEAAADHHFDDAAGVEVGGAAAADAAAVAQHRKAIRDLLNFFEEMGDVDDGDAAVAQPADQG